MNDGQRQRYARQLSLNGWSEEIQDRLLESRALVVGAGGLGSPAALYLAAAGIGRLTIVDGDVVELSNLNRQIIHGTSDLGRSKTASAKEKIEELNPDCRVEALAENVTSENALELFEKADIVLDCSDGFPSKYLLNDAAVLSKKPLVHAGVLGYGGQVTLVKPGSACLRCLFPEPPPRGALPTPEEAGILGTVAGVIGLLQANEAIKYLAGLGAAPGNRILTFDALDMRWIEVAARRNPACPVCGDSPEITILRETRQPSETRK